MAAAGEDALSQAEQIVRDAARRATPTPLFDPEMEQIAVLRSVCAALDALEPLASQARRRGWRHDEEEEEGAQDG